MAGLAAATLSAPRMRIDGRLATQHQRLGPAGAPRPAVLPRTRFDIARRRELPDSAQATRRVQLRWRLGESQVRPGHCKPSHPFREAEETVSEMASTIVRVADEQREALTAYAARAAWPSGFAIYQRGGVADGVFIVVLGRVVLRSRVRSGRGFVPWIATRGETFGSEGLHPGSHYVTDARAEDESETLFLSSARFRAFVREQPQHAIALFSQLMAERATLLDKLRELTTLSVEQRIVATLSRLAHTDIFAGPDGRTVLCQQRYRLLCELVGATRESVSLVLARLGADGLVERQGTTLIIAPLQHVLERTGVQRTEFEIPIAGLEQQQEHEHSLH